MAKVAFLGLGVMGFPMAGHLAAKGHEVVVYNRIRQSHRGAGHSHVTPDVPAKHHRGAQYPTK